MRSSLQLSLTGYLLPAAFVLLLLPGSLQSQIHAAAARNDTAEIRRLLEANPELLEAKNAGGATPLHSAASGNALAATALLVERGAALEVRDGYQRTPLHLCARERGEAAVCELLIRAGAALDVQDRFRETPLELAAWRGKEAVVELLLDHGAAIPTEPRAAGALLEEAASHGLVRLFRAVAGTGVDVAAQPALLHRAAAGGAVEIIAALAAAGGDVACADENGWTALHYAARDGRSAAVEWLVRQGAPLDTRTLAGQSPLNVAVEMQHDAIRDFLIAAHADPAPAQFPLLEGDYLGQAPPGDEPVLFARGIVSSVWGLHSSVAFSPDGATALWAPMVMIPGQTYSQGGVLVSERRDGRWSAPEWSSFTGPEEGDVPFFAPDGRRVYFISTRPLPGQSAAARERIWYAERTPQGWSAAQPVDDVVNEYPHHWQFSVDAAHTLYFSSRGDIHRSLRPGDRWQAPEPLGAAINTAAEETMPFIAPDGSYLLFVRDYDLFISFADPEGGWAEPQRLPAPINTGAVELCPLISPDGRYLFFLRSGGVWWVSAAFLERLRPQGRNRALAEIPIEMANDKTILSVTVGGATRRVILDSGMAYEGVLLFDTAGIDLSALHLVEGAVGGAGSGAPSAVLFDSAGSFSVGPLRFERQRVILLTSGTFRGFPTDGVIGYSLLGHFVVELDYDRNRMLLYEPGTFLPGPGWTPVDLYFPDHDVPWLNVRVATGTEPPVTLETYIDFASSEALELLERDSVRYTPPAILGERIVGRGLSGDVQGKDGRVARVRIGPFELHDVAVITVPASVRARQRTPAEAIVANGLLRRFNLIFDYAHSRLYLKPNRYFSEPFASLPTRPAPPGPSSSRRS